MHVIATAGHVDHGKSTVVRWLTGMEPDRFAEERQRGLTIDLGFAWTTLPTGEQIAFVDVPGHERFVRTMLAGVGPVPAVMFVVAADEGWMPQSEEHLMALDALGVQHGMLVVSRCDRADPGPVMRDALARISRTSLGSVPSVAVSAISCSGLSELHKALHEVVTQLPCPDRDGDVRLWIDRSFSVPGSGTVITGTLPAGTIRSGDSLVLARTGQRLVVRGLHSAQQASDSVAAVARVAVNLRGIEHGQLGRGDVLITPRRWHIANVIDVTGLDISAGEQIAHIGSAAVPVVVRLLATGAARLSLRQGLPLRVGDRLILRDPGRSGRLVGITVRDVRPPVLMRRGAARARGIELAACHTHEHYLKRVKFASAEELSIMGLPLHGIAIGKWRVDTDHWLVLCREVKEKVGNWQCQYPLELGIPSEILRKELGIPTVEILRSLINQTGLVWHSGRIRQEKLQLPPVLTEAMSRLAAEFEQAPFAAPKHELLRELCLGKKEIAVAVQLGLIQDFSNGVLLPADVEYRAVDVLSRLPQPFTASAARQALHTSRRVVMPLLSRLDDLGLAERLPDDTRRILSTEQMP